MRGKAMIVTMSRRIVVKLYEKDRHAASRVA